MTASATLWQILISFSQIGLFSLGGGNSMLKMIEDEVVQNQHWLTIEEFGMVVGGSFLFPGLTAVKVAGLVGLKVAGIPGLILSIIGVSVPGLLLAAVFYSVLLRHQESPIILKLITLMQYGALALLASALFALMQPLMKDVSWIATGLAIGLFAGVTFFGVSPFVGLVVFLVGGLILL